MKFSFILLFSTLTLSVSAQKKDSTGAFVIDSTTASMIFQLIDKAFDSKKESKEVAEYFIKRLVPTRIQLQPADKPKTGKP